VGFQEYNPPDDERRCNAKSKQTGERCRVWAVPGRAVCRFHGGLGGRPPVHGRYSKVLTNMKAKYESALEDDRVMDLRETLAVLDTALMEMMEMAEEGASPQSWKRAGELMKQLNAARGGDPAEAAAILRELDKLLTDGAARAAAMEAMTKAAERKAIRAEAAWKVRLDAAQAINARDLVTVFTRLVLLIEDELGIQASKAVVDRIDRELLDGALGMDAEQGAKRLAGRKRK
jgi:hypothetical protein